MNIVTIRGVEFEFSATDADFIAKCEDELEILLKRQRDRSAFDGLRPSEGYRLICGWVNEFFDHLFGEGTSDELFHGKNDVEDHLLAVDEFNAGLKAGNKGVKDLMNKYSQRQQASPHHQNKNAHKYHK